MEKITAQGPHIFVVSVAFCGVLNLVCAHSVFMGISAAPHLPVMPWIPALPWLAYVTGFIYLVPSILLLLNKRGQLMATLLGVIFVLAALTLVPFAVIKPLGIGPRTIVFESLALAGGSFVLAGTLREQSDFGLSAELSDNVGRWLFALSLVVFGIDHLLMLEGIASLIPFWIPGKLFWAWFTALAFIASGLSIAFKWHGRIGASLIGWMFMVWVLVLHGPRTVGLLSAGAGPHSPAEWSSLFIALGICGAGWICSRSPALSMKLTSGSNRGSASARSSSGDVDSHWSEGVG